MIISDGKKIKVYNGTGDTISSNRVVIVKGKKAYLASYNNNDCKVYPLGYTLENISPGQYGEVVLEGSILNIDTTSIGPVNSIVYLNTNGHVTITKPTVPIIIGTISKADLITGEIYFKVFSPSVAAWGDLVGNITDQSDLQDELNARVPYTGADHDVDLGEYKITMDNGTTDTQMSPDLFGVETNDGTRFSTLEYNGLNVTDSTIPSRMNVSSIGITFPDTSFQETAFPPTGGTDAQYIKGDGTLGTLPTGSGLPTGGTAGQILTKVDATDYNATWQDNYADWTSVVKHTVKNDGTAVITKGMAVYASGSNGTNILVRAASNSSEATSSKTMGLVQSQLDTSGGTQTGFVITEGLLGGLNTQGQTAGDPVWLGTNGNLIYGLTNKPVAPNHLVFIGIVTKVSAGSGEIFVKVQNGFELDELHNVDARSPSNSDGIFYNTSTSLWEHKSVATVLGYTPYDGGTNSLGFLTSSALTGYLTSATAASTYQPIISLTTTGTSGAATLVGSTLNIPQYAGTGSSASFVLISFSATGFAAATTRFYWNGGSGATTADSQLRTPFPEACTASKLYLRTTGTMNASASLVVTLFKNGASTALTLTIAGGSAAGTYSNISDSVSFAAGDGYSVQVSNPGTVTAAAMSGISFKLTI